MPNRSKDLAEADTPRQMWPAIHASFPSAPYWLKTFTPRAVCTVDDSHSHTQTWDTRLFQSQLCTCKRSTSAPCHRGTSLLMGMVWHPYLVPVLCWLLTCSHRHILVCRMGHQWFHSVSPERREAAESTKANLSVLESHLHVAYCYTDCW